MIYPDELSQAKNLAEGTTRAVTVNIHERNPAARIRCIEHYGTRCDVCGLDFEERYGSIGSGFIHIHHLKPLSEITKEYKVDPVNDLRPVCPNCHAMLHRRPKLLTILQLRRAMERSRNN